MNRQTFLEFLEQPAKLYQLSLTELQGLVMQYPYAANLRQLLLLKAKIEHHPRQEEILQQAAARTFDREFLFETLQELERSGLEGLLVPEEKLELQLLQDLAYEPIPLENNPAAEPLSQASGAAELRAVPLTQPEEEMEEEEDWLPPATAEAPKTTAGKVIEFEVLPRQQAGEVATAIATAASISELIAAMFSQAAIVFSPQPIASLQALASPVGSSLKERMQAHKNRQLAALRATATANTVEAKARQSVSDAGEAASETLAGLLVKQGQYERAIKMYRRLSLQIPAKKATFAALIKELKEKL